MNKKILFVGVNASYSHTQLSYGHIRAYADEMVPEWRWDYLETTIKEDEESLLCGILSKEPSLLLATSYLFTHEYLMRVVKRLHSVAPWTKIVLGGPQFLGHNSRFLKQNEEVTAVIRGDESSLPLFLDNCEKQEAWREILGLCYMDEAGEYCDNGFAEFQGELDELPSPYAKELLPNNKPFYLLETSRGCTGSCSFCTSSVRSGVKTFSLERIQKDLSILRKDGVKKIRIVDRTFNEDRQRAVAMLNMFREDFPQISFHLEINPAMLHKDVLAAMKKAPKDQLHLEVGVQTMKEDCLQRIKRPATSKKQLEGLKKLLNLRNFHIHADLIAGLPGQRYEDILIDLKTLMDAGPQEIQLENLKMLPGTPLATNPPEGFRWNPEPHYEILKTPDISLSELQRTRFLSKMVDGYYNVENLRNCFLFAFRHNENFPDDFLEHVIRNQDPLQKFALKKRFETLEKYAGKDELLSELCKFNWLANALPPEKYEVKISKCSPDMPRGELIWEGNGLEGRRYFIEKFAFNAADLWLNPKAGIINRPHSYLFLTSHRHCVNRVEKVA